MVGLGHLRARDSKASLAFGVMMMKVKDSNVQFAYKKPPHSPETLGIIHLAGHLHI